MHVVHAHTLGVLQLAQDEGGCDRRCEQTGKVQVKAEGHESCG